MKTIVEAAWEEFRDAGLLWWVNRMLHLFGWAIVVDIRAGKIERVFPARTVFRGFDPQSETDGFRKVTNHLAQEMPRLQEDVE